MYCSKCGTKVSDTSRFCNQCGEPITASVNPVIQKVMQGTPEQIQHFRNVLHEIVEGDNTASTSKKASTSLSKDLVDLIYEDILNLHIQALHDGRIDKDGNIAVAKFITTNLDKAVTYGDADRILAELTRQFPIHQAIYEKYHRVLIGFD